jgi:pseudoazurin
MKLLTFLLLSLCLISPALGADFTVEMLNKKGKERMVFSEKIVRIEVGDTINWKAKSKGHNVEFIAKNGVPSGVGKFKSKVSKNTQYKFTIPGIYAYWCTPHKGMGMIGFVIVGKNLDNISAIQKVKFIGKSKKIAKKLIASFLG